MFKFAALLASTLLATRVAAHGAVTSYQINRVTYPGYTGFSPASSPPTIEWQWPDYNPTLDPSDPKIMCNGGTSAPLYASVPSGTSITAFWPQWTHAQGSITVYMYKCPGDFSSCTGSGTGWFKIDEAGLLSGTMYAGTWGAGLVMDTLQWTSTIPPQLAPGNYLIRHELLAVHQANAPQFYAECGQIQVTGSGTQSPTGSYLVAIPGYAKLTDANVNLDIYADSAKTVTTWDVPGPDVWGGYGPWTSTADQPKAPAPTATYTGGTPPPVSSTSVKPPTSTSSTSTAKPPSSSSSSTPSSSKPSSSTSSTKTSSAPTTGQTLYGQCGGQGWAGPTTCASGTCKVSNTYYSQCLP